MKRAKPLFKKWSRVYRVPPQLAISWWKPPVEGIVTDRVYIKAREIYSYSVKFAGLSYIITCDEAYLISAEHRASMILAHD